MQELIKIQKLILIDKLTGDSRTLRIVRLISGEVAVQMLASLEKEKYFK